MSTTTSTGASSNKWLEPGGWLGIIAVLSVLLLGAGMKNADLQQQLPVQAKDLYATLAKSKATIQIVDTRDDAEEYDDAHVPNAIPFPNCDLNATPEEFRPFILKSVPTIVVSEEGDDETFAKCQAFFTHARNLDGGFEAWTDEVLPEGSGEYVPPKPGAGGGCL